MRARYSDDVGSVLGADAAAGQAQAEIVDLDIERSALAQRLQRAAGPAAPQGANVAAYSKVTFSLAVLGPASELPQ